MLGCHSDVETKATAASAATVLILNWITVKWRQRWERWSVSQSTMVELHLKMGNFCSLYLSDKSVPHNPGNVWMCFFHTCVIFHYKRPQPPSPQPKLSYDSLQQQQQNHGFVFRRDATSCVPIRKSKRLEIASSNCRPFDFTPYLCDLEKNTAIDPGVAAV